MTHRLRDQTRWRVTRDEEKDDVVKGRHGVISQYRDGDLDMWVLSVRIAHKLERAGWRAKNHYDDGAVFIRPWSDLDRAAKTIHARRKRQLSPDQRKAAAERLAKARAARKPHTPATFPTTNTPPGVHDYPQSAEMIPSKGAANG